MKKLILLLLFIPLVSFGQSWVFGTGIEGSSKFKAASKFSIERISYSNNNKTYSFGLELGIPLQNSNDYLLIDNPLIDNEITGYSPGTISLKYSRQLINRLSLSLSAGNTYAEEIGNMEINFSPFIVEKYNGTYINSFYYRVGLDYYFSFPMGAQIGFGSNGIFLGISYITKHRNLLKTIGDKNKKIESKRIKIGETRLSEVNLFDLREMIEVFIQDCKENGIIIKQNNIKSTYENLSQGVVAIAYGMNNDNEIVIKVDPIQWKNSSPSKKWYVLYHELGHDILNLDHGEGGKMMFNYVDRDYSWDEWFEDKNYMFESYKKYK